MEKFTAFIEKHIAPMANKLGRNKYVVALQNSFFAMIPFITVGALALVLISPPADYTTMDPGVARSLMQGWQAFADFTGPTFNFINMVTMNLLAFWIALGMGLNLAKHHKMTPAMPILVTTMSFLIWATMNPDGSLTFDYLGGTGLFVALVASILSFELYRTLTEKKVGHIDLSGAGVPPALADSLGNLLPVVIIFLIFGVSGQIIMSITGAPLPELMTILMSPLLGLVDSIGGIIFLAVLVMILWWFGIHDSVITGPLDVFLMSNYSANMAAFAAGTAVVSLPYIVNEPFWWTFMTIGGSGATLGLAVLAATSKSKQIRTVGRLGLIPGDLQHQRAVDLRSADHVQPDSVDPVRSRYAAQRCHHLHLYGYRYRIQILRLRRMEHAGSNRCIYCNSGCESIHPCHCADHYRCTCLSAILQSI